MLEITHSQDAVLHICLSNGWGGLEMYPISMAKEFSALGYKVFALCLEGSKIEQGMKESGIEVFSVTSKKHLILRKIPALNKWLVDRNINITHSHKSGDILISFLLYQCKARRAFFTEHMGVQKPKKDLYHKMIYRHLTRVFSISQLTYERNLRSLPISSQKLTCLRLGCHISPFTHLTKTEINKIKQEFHLDPKSRFIGNVGRLCLDKGQLELIDAFKILSEVYPDYELLIIGGLNSNEGASISYVEEIKQRILDLKLEKKVHLLGFQKETEKLLSIIDILCFPNRNEAFGLTLIEGMVAQKPIVAAKAGALPELLGGSGLYAEVENAESIAKQLTNYIENPSLCQKKAKEARERAIIYFSVERHVAMLATYYQLETIFELTSSDLN